MYYTFTDRLFGVVYRVSKQTLNAVTLALINATRKICEWLGEKYLCAIKKKLIKACVERHGSSIEKVSFFIITCLT